MALLLIATVLMSITFAPFILSTTNFAIVCFPTPGFPVMTSLIVYYHSTYLYVKFILSVSV